MALTASVLGTAGTTTTATTLALTSALAVAKDELIFVGVAIDNTGTSGVAPASLTVTDSGGNKYFLVQSALSDPGAVSAGAYCAVFAAVCVTALTTSSTITATTGTACAISFVARKVAATSGKVPVLTTSNITNPTTAQTAIAQTTPSSLNVGDVCFFWAALQNGNTTKTFAVTADSDTTNGSWGTIQNNQGNNSATTTSNVCVTSQGKTQTTAASTQTWNISFASTTGVASVCLVIAEQDPIFGAGSPAIPFIYGFYAGDAQQTPPSNGAIVSTWRDGGVLALGATFGVSSSGREPLMRTTGAPGSKPIVDFDGVDDGIGHSIPTAMTQPFSALVITMPDSPGSTTDVNPVSFYLTAGAGFSQSNGAGVTGNWTVWAGAGANQAPTADLRGTAIHTVTGLWNGASSKIIADGTTTTASATIGTGQFETFFIGNFDNTGSNPWAGQMAAVVVYPGDLSAHPSFSTLTSWITTNYSASTAWTRPINDLIGITDARAETERDALADTVGITDALALNRRVVISDTIGITDVRTKTEREALADTIGVLDTPTPIKTGAGLTVALSTTPVTVTDNFTRADSATTLGGSWQAPTNSNVFGITGNKAYHVSGTYGNTNLAVTGLDQEVTVTPAGISADGQLGIVVRFNSVFDYLLMEYVNSIGVWNVYKVVGLTGTYLGNTGISSKVDPITMRVIGTTLSVRVLTLSGYQWFRFYGLTETNLQVGANVGVQWAGATSNSTTTWDDFTVTHSQAPPTLYVDPQTLDRTVGAVSVPLTPATVAVTPQTLSTGTTINVAASPVTVTITPQTLGRTVGTTSVAASPVALTLTPQTLGRTSAGSVAVSPVTVAATPQTLNRTVGAASLAASPVAVTVAPQTLDRATGGGTAPSVTHSLFAFNYDDATGYPYITIPSGAAVGSVCYIGCSITSGTTVTTPSGWTLVAQSATSRMAVYRRVLTSGNPGSNVTFVLNTAWLSVALSLVVVSGQSSTPENVVGSPVENSPWGTTLTVTGPTTTVNNTLLLSFLGASFYGTTLTAAASGGYTLLGTFEDVIDVAVSIASQAGGTSGVKPNAGWTVTTEWGGADLGGVTLAVAPSGGATPISLAVSPVTLTATAQALGQTGGGAPVLTGGYWGIRADVR